VAQNAKQLETYALGGIDEVETDFGSEPAVRIRHLKSGWPLWMDIAKFCEKAPERIEVFTEELDFSKLD
jgi:hypothetical protein